jgi:hypothetical protein
MVPKILDTKIRLWLVDWSALKKKVDVFHLVLIFPVA